MNPQPSAEETALWQRRLASQANNRAWALADAPLRTPEEDEEMLQAAHAAALGASGRWQPAAQAAGAHAWFSAIADGLAAGATGAPAS